MATQGSSSHQSTPLSNSSQSTPIDSSSPSIASSNSREGTPPATDTILEDAIDSSLNDEKHRQKSSVWEHFQKKKVDGLMKAQCNYCGKLLGGASKNGTSHLHLHFKRCPRRKMMDIRQAVLTNNLRKEGENAKMGCYVFDQDVGRKELAKMIIMHEYPLNMVEHIGFRRYSSALQPLFKCPSRNTIKSDIFNIYDYEKEMTMELLEKNNGRVAITTDMWTSNNQKRGFMAITVHFIDSSWKLQSRIMRFAYVPCPHTKEVICEALMGCLLDWNVDTKLSTITLDNCSTNDAMIELLLSKLQVNSLLLSGTLLHMRCCAHILNLIVQDGLSVIKSGIDKIRESVAYWTATPKREERFEDTARLLKIPFSKKLGLDCPTRWNSTYLMLQTAIMYKDIFVRLKQRDSRYNSLPSNSDWEFAKEICGKLKLFYGVTELFSGTKYPTANVYFPKICEVRLALNQWLTSPIKVVATMASNMLKKFDKYWDVIHLLMGVAAVLDPRYKMTLLEYFFPKVYGSDSEAQVERIRQLCYDLLCEYQFRFNSGRAYNDDTTTSTNLDSIHSEDVLSDYDLFVRSSKRARTGYVKSELDNYLEEDVLPRSQDFDILLWWKLNGVRYPTLQATAKDLLAIPVSTVASESAFSTSGRLVNPHRSRLHPKTLEALMCAQNWLWAAENKDGARADLDDQASIYNDIDMDLDDSEFVIGGLLD